MVAVFFVTNKHRTEKRKHTSTGPKEENRFCISVPPAHNTLCLSSTQCHSLMLMPFILLCDSHGNGPSASRAGQQATKSLQYHYLHRCTLQHVTLMYAVAYTHTTSLLGGCLWFQDRPPSHEGLQRLRNEHRPILLLKRLQN